MKHKYFKRKHKRALAEIAVTAVLFTVCVVLTETGILPDGLLPRLIAYLVPYFLIGWRVLWKAARNIARGQVFDENFLMTIATIGALVVGEYPEAVFVMLFYRVGELFEELAVGKSRASIAALMEIRPDCAHVERGGETVTVEPGEVAVGEIIRIRPGERVPLDGDVVEGSTTLDTAALTGESLPRDAVAGDAVISGCVNLTGLVRVRVTKTYGDSTVSKILELVENAGEHKSRSEQYITRFARYYTPAVVAAAILLAVVPPLFLGMTQAAVWRDWILRAMSFLVISCPCALVISVPLSFFGGIGGASKCGILIKGSCYLEALAGCDTVVFDKTGTLTVGRFSVTSVTSAEGFSTDDILALAACAEQHSGHPIAQALAEACDPRATGMTLQPASVEEMAGYGVRAVITDAHGCLQRVAVGNSKLMESEGTAWVPSEGHGTAVYVSINRVFAGSILVADTVKPDAAEAIAALRKSGVGRTVMLTGDGEATASTVALALGLDEYHAALLPADKVERVEVLLADPTRRGKVAFVGDGINDAPVLARADIGIAMGGMGSDAAIEAADVVLMDDRVSGLPHAISIARRTFRIVKQNIVFALGVKAIILILGALGVAGLWAAVFADVGVAVLAILNAMRALRVKG
jgi:Cd2+/Zn2+-exporting ATPase